MGCSSPRPFSFPSPSGDSRLSEFFLEEVYYAKKNLVSVPFRGFTSFGGSGDIQVWSGDHWVSVPFRGFTSFGDTGPGSENTGLVVFPSPSGDSRLSELQQSIALEKAWSLFPSPSGDSRLSEFLRRCEMPWESIAFPSPSGGSRLSEPSLGKGETRKEGRFPSPSGDSRLSEPLLCASPQECSR